MAKKIINDTKMLRLLNEGMSQAAIAREFGVTPAAVNLRLKQLRGKTTYATAIAKVEKVVDAKLDVMQQLREINDHARKLLDEVEDDNQLAVKLMGEIRAQLKLAMDIFETLYSLEGAAQFQQAVLEVLEACDPELRKQVIVKLNAQSSLRSALRFK